MKRWKKWALPAAALLLLLALGLIRQSSRAAGLDGQRLESVEEMRTLLEQLGWATEDTPVSVQQTVLPKEFPTVLENYNLLQRQQGFDLLRHAGKRVEIYTFRVLNYPEEGEVYCTLYIRGGRLVAGDLHAASLNGFMTGLNPDPPRPISG